MTPTVIHVVQRDDASTGGALRVAFELVRRLPSRGVGASVLFLYGSEGYFGALLRDRCDYLRIINSRRILQFGRLREFLLQRRPDVMHFHDNLLWPQLLNLGSRPWKTVIHAHGGGTALPQPCKTQLLYALQRRYADQVVCITDETKASQIVNVGFQPKKMRVIHNGVDRSAFHRATEAERARARTRFGLATSSVVVGFVGRLHDAMKGCLDFVDVIHRLPNNFVGFVAGAGPDREAMIERGRSLSVVNRLEFAGLLEDVAPAYWAMDVFCFMSRMEPFGLTIAEAMACGVPVVGLSCPGGSAELLSDRTGSVVKSRDLDAMAHEVQKATRMEAPWPSRLAAASLSLDQRFSWDVAADRIAMLYGQLCSAESG